MLKYPRMQYATSTQRAVALLIDIIISLIWFIVPISLGITLYQNYGIELPKLLPLFLFLCIPIYFIYTPYKFGKTLGMKVMKIKIVNLSNKSIAFWQSIVRYLISITISCAVVCLGYIWIFFSKKKQTWHDMIAKTLVIKVK
ncbi:RDD family protein [Patescibacteria group bacterium]|nr:RDD family protein [Patescibacteria group bacterium]MBU1683174.1 RDD family protein [Patescibacteria group bacterium]MBU1934732.1 RDD family protein [Patescibacteria group bacterium]